MTAEGCTGQVLQVKRKVSVKGRCEHGLEKHATGRVLVVFDKACNRGRGVDGGVVRVKGKLVVPLLYAGVQGTTIASVEKNWIK